MNKNELWEDAGKIFNYNPSPCKEEISCTIGPLLALIGLKKYAPNISKPLSTDEISKKIIDKGLDVKVEDIIGLEPWYIGSCVRGITAEEYENKYLMYSRHFD
jgi:hypothetical protein